MPAYTCITSPALLGDAQRRAIAKAITRAHVAATGAPSYYVQVTIVERVHSFIGGVPADVHVMVRGEVRAGRDPAARTALAQAISREVADIAGVAEEVVWVYLHELPATDMIEFGHVLPPPGGETAWLDGLPVGLRKRLLALEAEN